MANAETTSDPESVVVATIEQVIERRGGDSVSVGPQSNLLTDLGIGSLDLAEVAGILADELGSEPFSDGVFPETVAELVAFYGS